jgi:hypothetical protein
MTDPHPQQDHEKVWKLTARGDAGMTIEWDTDLAYLRNQKRRYENMGMDCRIEESLCQPDTHTPAEPATDKFCDYQDTCARTTSSDCTYCDEAYSNKWKEHNATIRKAEREQVLDKKNIAIIRKGCLHPYWETCGGLNCCQHFVEKTGDCLFDVDAFIESLRGGATEEGGERR